MSLCVVDGLHCRCQPPEVPCDGVVKLNAEIERMKGEIARVQSLHEGLMKNADKMNDELRAEIAALRKDQDSLMAMCSLLEKCRRENERLNAEIARLREGWAKLSIYADEGWAKFQHIRRQAAEGKYGDKLRNEIIAPQATATIEPPA